MLARIGGDDPPCGDGEGFAINSQGIGIVGAKLRRHLRGTDGIRRTPDEQISLRENLIAKTVFRILQQVLFDAGDGGVDVRPADRRVETRFERRIRPVGMAERGIKTKRDSGHENERGDGRETPVPKGAFGRALCHLRIFTADGEKLARCLCLRLRGLLRREIVARLIAGDLLKFGLIEGDVRRCRLAARRPSERPEDGEDRAAGQKRE